ncbi:phosphopantetheine-binding protein [Streptomyces sp. JJ38]|uniref:phosphopantetheine-binding protein n=1 Tax=Streptomyces sp. JJ38 TaxID=2738128 RepID=UPI001C57707D|nr:phosphopantetheine-binding protein [Streptomyces sp. JJ38]MBW1598379.1 acyl carrier protein [Streptomyces sp. JJ38]
MVDVSGSVRSAWERALETGAIGDDDDFFVLGGTSLLAARLIAELNEELGLAVGLRTLVDHPTRRSLSEALRTELARLSQTAEEGGDRNAEQAEC